MSGETMVRRRGATSPLADRDTATTLPDGKHLDIGDEFTVPGEGRFRLKAIRSNGELNAWGPITSNGTIPNGRMRTFRSHIVRTVHRDARAIDTLREQEDN